MKSRLIAVAGALALGLGVLAAAPVAADPETTITLHLDNGGFPANDQESIEARQVGGPGKAYFEPGEEGVFTGNGAKEGYSGLTAGTWVFRVTYEDDRDWLEHAFRATLTEGANDLGTEVVEPRPAMGSKPLHGTVRSVKGTKLKGLDVEMYAKFPTVAVLESSNDVVKGAYQFFMYENWSQVLPGKKRPVIRPRLGTIESGPDAGRSKFLEPVTGYGDFTYKSGSSELNLKYRPRPFLKLNGAYRTSFSYNETYMPWASTRSTINVARKSGKITLSAYANVTKYGLKKAGGTMSFEIDGKTVKGYAKLNSKDQFTATIAGITPGEHVLRVGYHAGGETKSAAYVFDLVVS